MSTSVKVGELYATMRLDVTAYEKGLIDAQVKLTALDVAVTAVKAAAGTVGVLDPKLASSTAAAVAGVEQLRAAAIQAASAAAGLTLPANFIRDAARSTESIDSITAAVLKAGGQATTTAGNVGDISTRATTAAGDVGKISTELGQVQSAAKDASTATGKIDDGLTQASTKASSTASDVGKIGTQAVGAAADVGKVETELSRTQATAGAAGAAVGKIGDGLKAGLGAAAGTTAGGGFVEGFAGKVGDLASKTGPIAGSLLGVAALGLTAGALLIGAIRDGMQVEVSQDLFSAQTGLDASTTAKFGRAAGEAFANAFGGSVEENLATAKAAVQSGLLDPKASQADIQAVVEQLTGVSQILGTDIPETARAAGQAIKTGIAGDAAGAFDLLLTGSQHGLNMSQDWLDVITQYGTQFRNLGLDGPHAVGLLTQALAGGAYTTDLAGDALKEFSLRAVDGSKITADGFASVGLSADDMAQKIAAGGPTAAAGLAQTLDAIRAIKDPAAQAQAAVALFGTQSQDMGKALLKMDFNTATAGLEGFAGSAAAAVSVLGSNSASSVTGALNSITVAKQGLEAALAAGFGPYIQDFANMVSNNRAGVVEFFINVMDGAFDVARALVSMAATAADTGASLVEGLGGMAAGALHALAPLVGGLGELLQSVPGMGELGDNLVKGAAGMQQFADAAESGSKLAGSALSSLGDTLRGSVTDGLNNAQTAADGIAWPLQRTEAFNDAVTRLSNDVGKLGAQSDGTTLSLKGYTGTLNEADPAQKALADSLRGMVQGVEDQNRAGLEAGDTVAALTERYGANRQEILNHLVAMGLNKDQADALTTSYGLVPGLVATQVTQPGMPQAKSELDSLLGKVLAVPNAKTVTINAPTAEQQARLEALGYTVSAIPGSKQVNVTANTGQAEAALAYVTRPRSVEVYVKTNGDVKVQGGTQQKAEGGFMQGRVPTLVGELGPELIFPDQSGFVATAAQTERIFSAGSGGGGVATAPGIDYELLARAVSGEIMAVLGNAQFVVEAGQVTNAVNRVNRDNTRR